MKVNFSEKYGQVLTCHFCPEQESQSHLLSCKQITDGIDTSEVQYKDIFKSGYKQERITKVFDRILKQRNLKLNLLSS